jgi:uncharacterized protein
MTLPKFTYHPDPLHTGSLVASSASCICCGQARGYVYTGAVYGENELNGKICPWCIADGSAHAKLGAEFTDRSGIGGYGSWGQVSEAICDEIVYRTPGFSGWQQEQWWTHCDDAAEFLGPVGYKEALALGGQLLDRLDCGLAGQDRKDHIEALDRDHGPTGYAFRCRHCSKLGGYTDYH